jgi:hypothetical protein
VGRSSILLALAAYPNVRVKISGACTLSREPFPYNDIWDPVLRIIDAFGIDAACGVRIGRGPARLDLGPVRIKRSELHLAHEQGIS